MVTRNRSHDPSIPLVDYNQLGDPARLPEHPGLGNLPLYPDQDGWYSVLGSWNSAINNANSANPISDEDLENNIAIPIPGPPINPAGNARPSPPTIFCQYLPCSGASGPHTCAPGKFTCEAPDCSWAGTFKTKQAFNRHYLAMHLSDRVDCPVEGCVRRGSLGIRVADNLAAHMLNKHGITHPRMS